MNDLDFGDTIKGYLPGQRVFTRYTLKRLLGRGGMGVVWLVSDDELGRDAALKFLPEVVAADRAAIEDMKREVRRAIDLAHPHIVKINDFVTDGRTAAVSMEFIAGGTLSSLRVDQPNQVFSAERLAPWVTQLCSALDYAHTDAEIVHRDLKPVNLMVDGRGHLRVLDFGISASLSESVSRVSKEAGMSGTPLYMSPQQMMGETPAVSDDIYSVGAALFELLAGKPPFFTGNILLQVQNKPAPRLNERRAAAGLPPVPREWDEVLAACLAKNPGDRPTGAAEVARRLTGATFSPREGKPAKPAAPPPPIAVSISAPAPSAVPLANAAPESAPSRPPVHVPIGVWTGLGLASVALLLWLGDVPSRYLAARQTAAAEAAAGDWAGTLTARREATRLRPSDLRYRDAYRDAQARWLREIELELADLALGVAFDRFQALEPMVALLDSVHLERFRDLGGNVAKGAREMVQGGLAAARATAQGHDYATAYGHLEQMRPYAALAKEFFATEREVQIAELTHAVAQARDAAGRDDFKAAYAALERIKAPSALLPAHATTLQQVRETEVRFEISAALARVNHAGFADALAALEQTASRRLLGDEIAAAQARVRAAAVTHTLERVARGVAAERAEETSAALADYGRYTGTVINVSGEQLMSKRDLREFLATLEALRIRPTPGERRDYWRDLLLVASTRSRFTGASDVKAFLADGYTSWSRELADRGLPALALYLADAAQQEGATVAREWTDDQKAGLAARVDLRLAVEPVSGTSSVAPRLGEDPSNAARRTLTQRIGAWMPLVAESVRGENVLRLGQALKGPLASNNPSRERRSSRYRSGTRTVSNPKYNQLVSEVNAARIAVDEKSALLQQAKSESDRLTQQTAQYNSQYGFNAGLSAVAAVTSGLSVGVAQREYNNAVDDLEDLSSRLTNTQRTLEVADYSEEPYDFVTHNLIYSAELVLTPQSADGKLLKALAFASQLKHRTVEVSGNASRGVPVQKPQFPSAEQVDRELAADLANRAAQLDGILLALAPATFAAQATRNVTDSDLYARIDRRWALVMLWRSAGVNPAEAGLLEREVRSTLGLPVQEPG